MSLLNLRSYAADSEEEEDETTRRRSESVERELSSGPELIAEPKNDDGIDEERADKEPDEPTPVYGFPRCIIEEQHLDIPLPDRPKMPSDPKRYAILQQKVSETLRNRSQLEHIRSLQNRKDLRNPSIYEKLVDYSAIDETGSNFPPEMFDPSRFGPSSFYDELAKVQNRAMEKHEAEKPADKKTAPSSDRRRKSKWD